jgi:hypothetical protein
MHGGELSITEVLEDVLRDKQHGSELYGRWAAEAYHGEVFRLFMAAHETEQFQLREVASELERRRGAGPEQPVGWERSRFEPAPGPYAPTYPPPAVGLPGAGAPSGPATELSGGAYGYRASPIGEHAVRGVEVTGSQTGTEAARDWTARSQEEHND